MRNGAARSLFRQRKLGERRSRSRFLERKQVDRSWIRISRGGRGGPQHAGQAADDSHPLHGLFPIAAPDEEKVGPTGGGRDFALGLARKQHLTSHKFVPAGGTIGVDRSEERRV